MEAFFTVFVLLALAAAVISVAVWLHGRATEHRLAVLESVAELSQRVAQLEERVHGNDLAPLDRKLDMMTERIGQLDARLAAASIAGAAAPVPLDEPVAADPTARAVRHLEREGYSRTRVVSETEIEQGVRELRVETTRGDLQLKGSVLVARGAVADVRLTPVFELFP